MAASDVIGLAGLVVSILGFGLAFWQLRRTANATKATEVALKQSNKRMELNHLLILLPQFNVLEGDLDSAVGTNDREGTIRALVSFSRTASQVAVVLEGADPTDNATIVEKLRAAARQASEAKAQLVTQPTATILATVKDALTGVGEVATLAAERAAAYQMGMNR